jgi:CCR4-NOT transcription complex subunit 1
MNALLVFLQPFLKAGQLPDAVKRLYKGTLRAMLVMLHDFPDFLCDFHLSFCDLIPLNCVQLRNIVLSAFPRSMRLPDPFSPTLKMESVPESSQAPRILIDYLAPISSIRGHIDNYLTHQQPVDLPSKLPSVLLGSVGQLNVSLLTSVVVYIASCCVSPSKSTIVGPAMDIFKQLCDTFDAEARYVFINVVANQLRYPNSHTTFFSMVILALFSETKDEYVQEQITRVLLERLIVHRPHPVSFYFNIYS